MYDIHFIITSAVTAGSTATLMASVNSTLTAAVSSGGGRPSAFSTMLTLQFMNVTDAAGSIDANVFSGVTTPLPTVSTAVVTVTTQAPVSAPTLAPVAAASGLSKTSQIIIGAVVGTGSFIIIIAVGAYMRYRSQVSGSAPIVTHDL